MAAMPDRNVAEYVCKMVIPKGEVLTVISPSYRINVMIGLDGRFFASVQTPTGKEFVYAQNLSDLRKQLLALL